MVMLAENVHGGRSLAQYLIEYEQQRRATEILLQDKRRNDPDHVKALRGKQHERDVELLDLMRQFDIAFPPETLLQAAHCQSLDMAKFEDDCTRLLENTREIHNRKMGCIVMQPFGVVVLTTLMEQGQ